MATDSSLPKLYKRAFLLYDFKKGLTAAESSRSINDAFGEGTVPETTARNWLDIWKAGTLQLSRHLLSTGSNGSAMAI